MGEAIRAQAALRPHEPAMVGSSFATLRYCDLQFEIDRVRGQLRGAGLGLAKGLLTSLVLFGLILYADRARGWNSTFAASIEGSVVAQLYSSAVRPYLETFPAFRIVTSVGHLNEIGELCAKEPWRFAELVNHPELKALANHPRLIVCSISGFPT